jgi:hypothetical protein
MLKNGGTKMKKLLVFVVLLGGLIGNLCLAKEKLDNHVLTKAEERLEGYKKAQAFTPVEPEGHKKAQAFTPVEPARSGVVAPTPGAVPTTLPVGSYQKTCKGCVMDGTMVKCMCEEIGRNVVFAQFDVTKIPQGHQILNCNGVMKTMPRGQTCDGSFELFSMQ